MLSAQAKNRRCRFLISVLALWTAGRHPQAKRRSHAALHDAGAAIGGALGAGAGALVGDQFQGQENRQLDQQRQVEEQNREIQRQREELERLKSKPNRNEDEY